MSAEHARRHFLESRKGGLVNCASVVLTAIVPHEPTQRFLEAGSRLDRRLHDFRKR